MCTLYNNLPVFQPLTGKMFSDKKTEQIIQAIKEHNDNADRFDKWIYPFFATIPQLKKVGLKVKKGSKYISITYFIPNSETHLKNVKEFLQQGKKPIYTKDRKNIIIRCNYFNVNDFEWYKNPNGTNDRTLSFDSFMSLEFVHKIPTKEVDFLELPLLQQTKTETETKESSIIESKYTVIDSAKTVTSTELQDINNALQQACSAKTETETETETKENDFNLLLSLLAKYQNVIKVSNTKLSNMQVHVQNGVITIKKR